MAGMRKVLLVFCALVVPGFVLSGCGAPQQHWEENFIPIPPPVNGHSKPLNQFTAAELQTLYGKPDFVRIETGSQMWRYDAGICRIFFFLYPQNEPAGGSLAVRQMESVPSGRPGHVDRNCFNALQLRVKPA